MQELFPKSRVHLLLAVVLNAYTEAEYDANKLFHLLFNKLFTDEENVVPFGGKQGVPSGKGLLDQDKVRALKGKCFSLFR